MIINDDILRRDTIQLLKQIDQQIEEVNRQALELGIPGYQLRDGKGNWMMSPLLLAKAQAYNSLILLQTQK